MKSLTLPAMNDLPLLLLENRSGLRIRLTPDGRLFDLRCGDVLINQVLPTPAEAAMTRIYLRDRGTPGGAVALLGPPVLGTPFGGIGSDGTPVFLGVSENMAHWSVSAPDCEVRLSLQVHPTEPAWSWRVSVRNAGVERRRVDVLYGQDLGLAHEGFVRMNEAYCSQYIDHTKMEDAAFGPVLLARQNQAQDDRFPWIAQGCLEGAASWSTDGYQFFGLGHRLTGQPDVLDREGLDGTKLQYEFAYPALQSPAVDLESGRETAFTFFAIFRPDHPDASGEGDLDALPPLLNGWPAEPTASEPGATANQPIAPTLFDYPWLPGEELTEEDWAALFPGEMRHEERDGDGRLLSFFTSEGHHVVSRRKEERVERPHAHVLRTGNSLWLDDDILGTTVGMAGAFNAQVFLGNTNLVRFLSVLRNPLNVMRGSGQRIFVIDRISWKQLGIPSAFEMGLRHARWLYKTGETLIEVTSRASEDSPSVDLEVRVLRGGPREFMVSHLLLMGDNEMSQPVNVTFDEKAGRIECRPEPDSLMGQKWPDVRFLIETDPKAGIDMGDDEWVFGDGETRHAPFAVLAIEETREFRIILRGDGVPSPAGIAELSGLPALPRLSNAEAAAGRTGELLPWFAHDAWIHFTTPHGIEQYGGAAWGTRDVCQGPVEWLLATRRYAEVRRILLQVFEQQYEADGGWPQWFMFEPFRFIQSVHSHGDIVFWPLMALCQYVEASGDFGILDVAVPYTDPATFTSTPHVEPISDHAEKILAQHDARRLPGTALVNYGDGDWDDTLQPADPKLRTHMASAWTVGLAYDAFRRYRDVCDRAGRSETAEKLGRTLEEIGADVRKWLMPDGVTAGFLVMGEDGPRPLLHPRDEATGIRYRLLPMTRGVLSELFTPEEARAHLDLVREHLLFPDGVRLMSDPIPYRGGVERRFKRAETAANFGREVGLMYTHAHLRYAEALAKLGDGEGLWRALQTVNPILLNETVPNATLRQSNVYYTSSDGAFPDRYEAAKRFGELRDGRVPVKGGWRLYSSGPGLYVHKVITRLLGLRDSFGDVVLDPVLPPALDGLTVEWEWSGKPLTVCYHVRDRGFAPNRVTLNNQELTLDRREPNPYRDGGVRIDAAVFMAGLRAEGNRLEIYL